MGKTSHSVYYQRLLLLGAVLYPMWWILFKLSNPLTLDSLMLRVPVGIILLLAAVSTRFFSYKERFIEDVFLMCALLMTLNYFYITYVCGMDESHLYCTNVLIAAIIVSLDSMRGLVVYSVVCLITGTLLPMFATQHFSKLIYLGGLYTTISVLYFPLMGRIKNLKLLTAIQKRLTDAQSMAHIGNFEYNVKTKEIYSSQESLRLMGIIGDEHTNIFQHDEVSAAIDYFANSENKESEYKIFKTVLTAAGAERQLHFHFYCENDLEGHLLTLKCLISDITETVKAEKLLALQQEKLFNSSKMTALGEMAGGIAHEINNPLAVIHGRAGQLKEMAQQGDISKETVVKFAEKIEITATRIAKIVKSLRTFARDGDDDYFHSAPLKTIVSDTLELCQERFRNHNIQLLISDIPPHLAVECKSVQISQVLINLLSNAHDAVEGVSDKWVRLDVFEEQARVELHVQDSGPGIPANLRDKLFQPFYTSKEVGKGIGMGLTVCKGLVEGHGGTLNVDLSGPNTKFVVSIPKTQKKAS